MKRSKLSKGVLKRTPLGEEGIETSKLLRGDYERQLTNNVSMDEHVPDIGYNILHRQGPIHKPIVDREYLESGGQRPAWPDQKPFAVALTHDVDAVSKYSLRKFVRRMSRIARDSEEPTPSKVEMMLAEGTRLPSALHGKLRKSDPYHGFDRWLEVEESVGGRSTFFFMPEESSEPHSTDRDYRYSDTVVFDGQRCTVADMMREMDRRGWEIGLHPTWNAYDDPEELARQKAQIEQVLGHDIESVRQHFLHYDIKKTPRSHAEAGFKYDSTLGFNDSGGFRFGTSYPWQLYDFQEADVLPVLEIPLICQDGALLGTQKGLKLDEESAFSYVAMLAERVEEVGGVLTLNWHSRFVNRPTWWRTYERILKRLERKNAWFASVEEIGDWWMQNGFNILH